MTQSSPKLKLLLHVCCGPCATAVLERLQNRFTVSCLWYNPNIEPDGEYHKRLASMRTVAREMGVSLVEGSRDTAGWHKAVASWEEEPEGGKRCRICFAYRLGSLVGYAQNNRFSYVATTLTISPHKNAQLINSLGKKLTAGTDVEFLAENWRKRGGFQRSVELSKQLGLYRQSYCGCMFSLPTLTATGNSSR